MTEFTTKCAMQQGHSAQSRTDTPSTTDGDKVELGLAGKRFLVTGGTRGIGRAVVDGLLAEGAAVGYCARTAEAVPKTESELKANGATAIGAAVDVGDAAALKKWVDDSAAALGSIDGEGVGAHQSRPDQRAESGRGVARRT